MKLDLHIHTSYSHDSLISVDTLVKICRTNNILPAVTDHNTLSAHDILKRKGFKFIPGIEISTKGGHIIVYYPSEPIKKGLSADETIDIAKEQGAVVCASHPFDTLRKGVNNTKILSRCDMIEVFNARVMFQSVNDKALAFAKENSKVMSAGSDAHFPFEVGHGGVIVDDDSLIDSPKDFLKVVATGNIHRNPTIFLVHGVTRGVKLLRRVLG